MFQQAGKPPDKYNAAASGRNCGPGKFWSGLLQAQGVCCPHY